MELIDKQSTIGAGNKNAMKTQRYSRLSINLQTHRTYINNQKKYTQNNFF